MGLVFDDWHHHPGRGPDRAGARLSGFCDRPRIAPSSAPDPRPPVSGVANHSPPGLACVRRFTSASAAVAFPAWCRGHAPSAQIVCVSYAQDLADKLSRDCRHILASDWYRGIFPTRLSPQRAAMPEFDTTAQGWRLATSVGGVLTGRGADIIIIDDPLKPEEALSQAQRQAANEWFDHTLYSRLNDKQKGAIVVIMHRLHEDDLVGHVLAQEEWEIVRFPAIAEDDESQLVDTLFGPLNFTRPARRGVAPGTRAACGARAYPPHDRRIQFRRPVPAGARP